MFVVKLKIRKLLSKYRIGDLYRFDTILETYMSPTGTYYATKSIIP